MELSVTPIVTCDLCYTQWQSIEYKSFGHAQMNYYHVIWAEHDLVSYVEPIRRKQHIDGNEILRQAKIQYKIQCSILSEVYSNLALYKTQSRGRKVPQAS